MLIGLLLVLVVLPGVLAAAKVAQAQAPVGQAVDPKRDAQGVKTACSAIVPALMQMETDVAKAASAAEYTQVLTQLRTTIEKAAHASTDPVFVQDVQTLSGDFQKAIDATNNGQNPATLEGALTADGNKVGGACDAAGYVQN
jgi:hypothetical protein